MPDLVRVRVGRVDFNTGRARALALGFEVLDEPTHDRGGKARPETRNGRPAKPKVSVADAAEKKAAPSATKSDTALPKEN